jgi:hypothetical protein
MRAYFTGPRLWQLVCLVIAVALSLTGQAHADPGHFGLDPTSLIFVIGAVTPTTLTELNDLAKDYYSNVYVQLINPETPLKAQFSKLENADFTGRKWIFGVKTAVGGGSANAGANKTLPEAQEGLYDQGEATVVRTYTRMALDGLAIEVTKKKTGSYRPALAEVMSDRMTAHDLEVNRQMFCNGDGQVALLAVDGGVTQTLEKDYGVVNGGLGTRHFYVGDFLQPYSQAHVARTKTLVTAVDHVAGTITVTPDPVTTAGDYFARATVDDDNHLAGEAFGLLAAIKDSVTHHGIPATGPWKAVRLHNGGVLRPISDSLVMQMVEQIRARARQVPNLVVTRPGVVLKYSELFLPLRRLDGQDVQLKGGYKPIAAIIHAGGAIPVIGDNDCPNSRLFFINTSGFRLADLVGSEWADMDGATFDRITDKDGIEGYIRKYWQVICVQRNSQGVLEDVEDIGAIDRVA